MSRRSYYGLPGGTRNPFGSTGKKPRPLVLPDEDALRARLLYHTRREWVATPIQAPAPCWASSALAVYMDLFHGVDGY